MGLQFEHRLLPPDRRDHGSPPQAASAWGLARRADAVHLEPSRRRWWGAPGSQIAARGRFGVGAWAGGHQGSRGHGCLPRASCRPVAGICVIRGAASVPGVRSAAPALPSTPVCGSRRRTLLSCDPARATTGYGRWRHLGGAWSRRSPPPSPARPRYRRRRPRQSPPLGSGKPGGSPPSSATCWAFTRA